MFRQRYFHTKAHDMTANYCGEESKFSLVTQTPPHRAIGYSYTIGQCPSTSARVSRVGLSTKQATEPYSDNLLNRTRNPSEPHWHDEIPLKKSFEAVALLVGWILNWESTENWHFHRFERYPKPYSDTSWYQSNLCFSDIAGYRAAPPQTVAYTGGHIGGHHRSMLASASYP